MARLTITVAAQSPANAIQIRTRERIKLGEWHHMALTYDGFEQGSRVEAVRQRRGR